MVVESLPQTEKAYWRAPTCVHRGLSIYYMYDIDARACLSDMRSALKKGTSLLDPESAFATCSSNPWVRIGQAEDERFPTFPTAGFLLERVPHVADSRLC